jgi:hypothetical protein
VRVCVCVERDGGAAEFEVRKAVVIELMRQL